MRDGLGAGNPRGHQRTVDGMTLACCYLARAWWYVDDGGVECRAGEGDSRDCSSRVEWYNVVSSV